MNSAKKQAKYWKAVDENVVLCKLCPHHCRIAEAKSGICRVRENIGGTLYAASYGLISSLALDPIEKKPLRHFHPGSQILSIGGFGCNFRCPFCQNFRISLEYDKEEGEHFTPEAVLGFALQTIPKGNIGVAYTYNEPLIGYEFVYDCAKLIHEAGLKNVVVTNGFVSEDTLMDLLPLIDAMNIDLKSFSPKFYQKIGGELEAVKQTIKIANDNCHVEVTTLVIPGENEDDIIKIAKWLATINADIPLHLTRFQPQYKYDDRIATNVMTITRLAEEASRYLKNVLI